MKGDKGGRGEEGDQGPKVIHLSSSPTSSRMVNFVGEWERANWGRAVILELKSEQFSYPPKDW